MLLLKKARVRKSNSKNWWMVAGLYRLTWCGNQAHVSEYKRFHTLAIFQGDFKIFDDSLFPQAPTKVLSRRSTSSYRLPSCTATSGENTSTNVVPSRPDKRPG